MKMSNENKNIIKALLHVQEEIQNPKKTEENPYYKSKYAPLDQILNETRELLTRHGLVLVQDTGADEDGRVVITTTLLHESGEWITTNPLIVKPAHKRKDELDDGTATPQEVGSAITYARRYQLMSLLAVAGEEDDDGNHASRTPQHRPSKTRPAGQPRPGNPKPKKPNPVNPVRLGVLTPERFKEKEIQALILMTKAEKGEPTLQNVLMKLDELHADGRVTQEEYMNMREKLGVKT